ncbi:jg14927 [Pararge aegeria aegeria]|uniref:Jg14927 protein n=1 Tax=Pararge aegeria aegeria TaxID=348720 RepID=A0A8S4QHF2_9NEOP|nr:jg14927 [Pararge aegeria aegeria]
MPCGGGRSEYSCRHPISFRVCRTRLLREDNEERAAGSSVLLLPSTVITNLSAQRGDNGGLLGEASSPAVDCYRLLLILRIVKVCEDSWKSFIQSISIHLQINKIEVSVCDFKITQ